MHAHRHAGQHQMSDARFIFDQLVNDRLGQLKYDAFVDGLRADGCRRIQKHGGLAEALAGRGDVNHLLRALFGHSVNLDTTALQIIEAVHRVATTKDVFTAVQFDEFT